MSYYDWHAHNNYGCVIGSTNSSQAKEFQMHYSFEKKKERIFSSVKKCMWNGVTGNLVKYFNTFGSTCIAILLSSSEWCSSTEQDIFFSLMILILNPTGC